jgi:hypothetical protein
MIVGWIVSKTYGSGFTEFLQLSDQNIQWTGSGRQATIFRDRESADQVIEQLKHDHRIDLMPVETYS